MRSGWEWSCVLESLSISLRALCYVNWWCIDRFKVWRREEGLEGGGGGVMNCKGDYNCWIFRMESKILLGNIVWLSLRWLSWAASLWMWNRSNVCKCGPFFWLYRICTTLPIVPRECACSFKCFANREEWLLFRKARLCSLYLLIKCNPFVLCTLYCSLGNSVCILLWIKICHGCSYCMLSGCKWYCLCSRLFLYPSVWICWWSM
jgi:hypothetical protein